MSGRATFATDRFRLATAATRMSERRTSPDFSGPVPASEPADAGGTVVAVALAVMTSPSDRTIQARGVGPGGPSARRDDSPGARSGPAEPDDLRATDGAEATDRRPAIGQHDRPRVADRHPHTILEAIGRRPSRLLGRQSCQSSDQPGASGRCVPELSRPLCDEPVGVGELGLEGAALARRSSTCLRGWSITAWLRHRTTPHCFSLRAAAPPAGTSRFAHPVADGDPRPGRQRPVARRSLDSGLMDLHVIGPLASPAERAAVDAVLGPPESGWVGGPRDAAIEGHAARGGHATRARRSQLLPALHAVQSRIGWISQPALNYICKRLAVAAGRGVRRRDVLRPLRHEAAAAGRGPRLRRHRLPAGRRGSDLRRPGARARPGRRAGPATAASTWLRSPCLGLCDLRAGGDDHRRRRGRRDLRSLAPVDAVGVARRARVATAAPATGARTDRVPQAGGPRSRLLGRVGVVDPTSLDDYRASGGYAALARAHRDRARRRSSPRSPPRS